VSLTLALYVRTLVARGVKRTTAMTLLVAGLIAALSRGPWVGALAGLLAYAATMPGAGSRIAKYGVVTIAFFLVLDTFPAGREILDLLPFVGTLESGNIEYRRQLISVAFQAIWQSPWFGGIDIYAVEGNAALRQGYGFIDVVNTYVGILLGTGFVGLCLFLALFAATGLRINRASKRVPVGEEPHTIGRALLASLVAVLVTIFTVSSITIIGPVYWCLLGIGIAYARVVLGLQASPTRAAGRTEGSQVRGLRSASVPQ
jgi:O-antigen ligase